MFCGRNARHPIGQADWSLPPGTPRVYATASVGFLAVVSWLSVALKTMTARCFDRSAGCG